MYSNINKVVSVKPLLHTPNPAPIYKGGRGALLQPSHQNSIQGLTDLCAGVSLCTQESLLEGLLSVPQHFADRPCGCFVLGHLRTISHSITRGAGAGVG